MGCRILAGSEYSGAPEQAVFFCSTTDWAFGPVMNSREEAEAFAKWLPQDPRVYKNNELQSKYHEFVMLFVCECGGIRQEEEAEPAIGERFHCDYCTKKAARQTGDVRGA